LNRVKFVQAEIPLITRSFIKMDETENSQTGVNNPRTSEGSGAKLTQACSRGVRLETSSGHTILADEADAELLAGYRWFAVKAAGGHIYAQARVRGTSRRVAMHRLLMSPPAGSVVHHRNNNGLDNRRANLEVTSQRQNTIYAFDGKEAGVHFHKQTGKWRAQLRGPDGKFVSLGLHETREAAVFAATTFREERA
jgi:hypothetical protein